MQQAPRNDAEPLGWQARLDLSFHRKGDRTCSIHHHEGPLRVLQPLYPEGPGVCHHVLVHPPGGLVGGDRVDIGVQVLEGAHAFVTTPGATRFYRSVGPMARQKVQVQLAAHSRLEWLPLETIAYDECRAQNQMTVSMQQGAQLMAWEVLALGLPQANQPYRTGRYLQHLEIEGVWLDRGWLDGEDALLMNGPVGLMGHRCLATLVLAAGSHFEAEALEGALDQARSVEVPSGVWLGVTSPHPRLVVARVLASQTEPTMAVLQRIWAAWRTQQWGMPAVGSRMWRV